VTAVAELIAQIEALPRRYWQERDGGLYAPVSSAYYTPAFVSLDAVLAVLRLLDGRL
jgi:hypothetical protein